MSVTPEPEIIVVETPPDSPIWEAEYVPPALETHSHQPPDYSSPKKRARTVAQDSESCQTKRTRKGLHEPTNSNAANDVTPESQPQQEGGGEGLTEPSSDDSAGLEELDQDMAYSAAVMEERAGLYPITRTLFVAQGWDERSSVVTTSWYHLQRVVIGNDIYMACTCQHVPRDSCIHESYLRKNWEDKFEYLNEVSWDAVDDRVVLFCRQTLEDPITSFNIFSVAGSNTSTPDYLNHRAIVFYEGQDCGDGMWTCSKDKQRSSSCKHITDARHHLQKLLHANPDAMDDNIHPAASSWLSTRDYDQDLDKAVSHRTILPPCWAMLPTDNLIYPRARPVTSAPECILLTNQSTCICGAPFDAINPVFVQPCIIYGLAEAFSSSIQLQACPQCPPNRRSSIGPDARELGIFNLNNRQLFTHELLDEYTGAYTASETPFVAWVTVVSRRYTNRLSSIIPFVSEDKFRNAWFAFTRLQDFRGDMACPYCGPSPDDVIWDGVTLGFSKKHLLRSIEPPTVVDDHSLIRNKTSYDSHQQLFPSSSFRKLLRNAINAPELLVLDEDTSIGDLATRALTASAELEYLQNLGNIEKELRSHDSGLGDIFSMYFGVEARAQRKKAPASFKRLFIQLAADESVLQMATRKALHDLERFIQSPTPFNASQLVSIPALYNVLILGNAYDKSILSLCKWIYNRGMTVLKNLMVEQPLTKNKEVTYNKDWRSTGCLYSMPQIRSRPKYPKLIHDQRKDSGGNRGDKCSKYYSQYGEQRLTGGIMGAWCTHSICYGFHFIPSGEGRNDVFSAMVTRWPQAPKRVIYDFACALGPYCLLREPDFFADTLFVIDDFHAMGHTKCCPAAFLSSYSRLDPRLKNLNSSAAECGNGGISRIRKSVSYMSQTRAFQYTKVFISVWNRNKIQKLAKRK